MQTHKRITQTTKHGALAYFIYLAHCVEALQQGTNYLHLCDYRTL